MFDERALHNVCRLCGAGCGIVVDVDDNVITKVRGDRSHPVTEGYVCTKGRSLPTTHHDPRRLLDAAIGRMNRRARASLDHVVSDLGTQLRRIRDRHGPDSIGLFLGTKVFNESDAFGSTFRLASALKSRSLYSIDSIDVVAKVVAGLKLTGLRHSLYPPRFDYRNARLVLMFGLNPIVSHTQGNSDALSRIRGLTTRGEVWVVDPRRTETSLAATRHLQIRAGTDLHLLGYLVRELLEHGADFDYIMNHVDGADDLRRVLEPFDAVTTARRTGLHHDDLTDLLATIRKAGRLVVCTGTGTRMGPSATATEWLGYVLAIITGSFDREGGHLVMNRGLFHAPDWATAHAPGPVSRPELSAWAGQYPCTALADEALSGNLRALVVFGGNPMLAIPDEPRVRAALSSLEVLAVHDVVPTATTELATHLFPATGQFEQTAVVRGLTRSGLRHAQFVPALFNPEGDRRPASWLVRQLGRELELEPLIDMGDDQVHAAPASRLEASSTLCETEAGVEVGSFTDDLPAERWDLTDEDVLESIATVEDPAPLVLIGRRQTLHVNWYMTDLAGPSGRTDDAAAWMHPLDASARGLRDGDVLELQTAQGSLRTSLRVTDAIAAGAVSVPHGHTSCNVNSILSAHKSVDAISGMPLLSGVAVEARRSLTAADS